MRKLFIISCRTSSSVPLAARQHIPIEVWENVIDMLYSDMEYRNTWKGVVTLRSCCLVCRAWRFRAQRNLFYRPWLSDHTSLDLLSAILDEAQPLRGYVHEVILIGHHLHTTASIFPQFAPCFATKLPNLKCIRTLNLENEAETWFPRISDSPKTKHLQYIPLYPHFPGFLSSFKAVVFLDLKRITFRSFGESARVIHGFPNLEYLSCYHVRWITPCGSHVGTDLTNPPDWEVRRCTLPNFAPNLRNLLLDNISLEVAGRLILTRGPFLVLLDSSIPLSSSLEEPDHGGVIDLSSCTGLHTLVLSLLPQFSIEAHAGFVKELLASWKPQSLRPLLVIWSKCQWSFTRRGFADALRGLGSIIETLL
ncbi:hypothetical protein V8D89_008606 [Ganoderma adspersum]